MILNYVDSCYFKCIYICIYVCIFKYFIPYIVQCTNKSYKKGKQQTIENLKLDKDLINNIIFVNNQNTKNLMGRSITTRRVIYRFHVSTLSTRHRSINPNSNWLVSDQHAKIMCLKFGKIWGSHYKSLRNPKKPITSLSTQGHFYGFLG